MSRKKRRPSVAGTGGTAATVALAAAGVKFTLHPYEHDPATTSYGLEAVAALGLDPHRVFKTLFVEVDGAHAVGVVPVAGQLDLKAFAAALGGKRATMADPAVAERLSGDVLGGISPLGMRRPQRTVLDSTALDFPTIFVSAGKRGADLELTGADLVGLSNATVAPIARLGA